MSSWLEFFQGHFSNHEKLFKDTCWIISKVMKFEQTNCNGSCFESKFSAFICMSATIAFHSLMHATFSTKYLGL